MSDHIKTPSNDLQHIRFEGNDVCIVAADDYDALAARLEQWKAAWDEARDAILNGRGPLEAMLDSDQTNAVLSVIDEAYDSYIASATSGATEGQPK